MELDTKNFELQEEEIKQKILDKITFNCPHCHKEINETHLDEKGKYFQNVKEKIRRANEEEFNYQRSMQKRQLLKQIEAERGYENFAEVVKDKKTIEELTRVKKSLEEEMLREKLKFKDDLVKVTSYDEIKKLDGFKELEKKVENYRQENEQLKIGNQPEIEKLKAVIKKLEKDLADKELQSTKELAQATSADAVNELKVVKELKAERDKYQKESKDLQEQNHQLTLLSQKKLSGQELEKDFFGELTKVFGDRDKITDIRGEVGKKADFLQEVLTEKGKPTGRIIYETKNTKDWGRDWVEKLEKDMAKFQADFGFIIATCVDNSKATEQIDPRKKIYAIGYNNNVFMVARIMRKVLINKCNFREVNNSTDKDKEQKLKRVEEWVNDKLPRYVSGLEEKLKNQENYAEAIIGKAKKIKEFKEEIQELVMNNINLEIKALLS